MLVRQGVPAAIATARQVFDNAALRFAGELYQAFAGGFPAEAALVEARKALALKGWDWSAYVMYACPEFPLHELRVQQARSSGPALTAGLPAQGEAGAPGPAGQLAT